MSFDINGRKADDAIRQIACDLLADKEIKLKFKTGKEYSVEGLDINALHRRYPDPAFVLRLEYYEMDSVELFEEHADQILIRSRDETETYWQGFA